MQKNMLISAPRLQRGIEISTCKKAAEISEGIILGVHGPKAKLSPIEFCLVHQTKTIIPEWKITSQFADIPQMFQQIQDIPHVQIQKTVCGTFLNIDQIDIDGIKLALLHNNISINA